MAEKQQSGQVNMTAEERKNIIKNLKEQEELFSLQASISTSKATIVKANYEFYLFTSRLNELKNPKKEENEPSTTDNKESKIQQP